jgi:hyperosmotically inducible periplasmic protein
MKTMMNALKLAAAATAVVFSVNAWPQTTDAASGSMAAPSTSAAPTKKEVRKANRALSRKVSQALQKGGIDTVGLNVIAKGGAITLAGYAQDAESIDKATTIAKGVDGVKSVKNALTIQEGGQ